MIFNCKELAESELNRLSKLVEEKISLGVIQIGENKVSEVYINEKRKAAKKIGVNFNHYKFPDTISKSDLSGEIKRFSDDGLIVQLPIKGRLNTQEVLNLIPFEKDIDVLSEVSLGRFYTGNLDILPPVTGAVDKILSDQNIDLRGKVLGVVGPGRLVGKPTLVYGLKKGASLVSIDENTSNPEKLISKADVLVTGVGRPNLIKKEMVKEGSVIIDAGTSKESGRVLGDVDLENVKEKVSLVTPVPGGVGPLTVVSLLENLIKRKNGN